MALARLDPEITLILDAADLFACAIFLADFVRNLVLATDRRQYVARWG